MKTREEVIREMLAAYFGKEPAASAPEYMHATMAAAYDVCRRAVFIEAAELCAARATALEDSGSGAKDRGRLCEALEIEDVFRRLASKPPETP